MEKREARKKKTYTENHYTNSLSRGPPPDPKPFSIWVGTGLMVCLLSLSWAGASTRLDLLDGGGYVVDDLPFSPGVHNSYINLSISQ